MIEEKFQAVVLGAGESGVGAALLYQSRGISVMVSDYGHIAPKYKQELEANGIPYEEGSHTTELILRAEEIVKSPGIPEKAPIMVAYPSSVVSLSSPRSSWQVATSRVRSSVSRGAMGRPRRPCGYTTSSPRRV